ncbi:hypothetical protein DM02DRAFT_495781, partial [Periconia macrospinosa]
QKDEIVWQLRGIFSQLRNNRARFIGSFDRSACELQLFAHFFGHYGPYLSEDAFNKGMITALKNQIDGWRGNRTFNSIRALKDHDIVMTHGNLHPRSIIVDGTRVVAILDCSVSGYYPEYWDWATAVFNVQATTSWGKQGSINRIM